MKTIELNGVVGWDISAVNLKAMLPENGEDVYLKVDSPGGSVFEGNRLYNALKDYSGKITVELGALAASAASFFPLAVGVENIKVRENSVFMAHKAWAFMIGNADEMMKEAEILDGFDRLIARVYSEVTKKPIDETLKEMSNELWLIGGEAIVKAGFASEVVVGGGEKPREKSEVKAMVAEAKNVLKESFENEDLMKWAAYLENATVRVSDVVNIVEKEKGMNLNEYLAQNPDGKAEFENAKNEAVKKDRDRVAEILTLAGAAVNAEIVNAVSAGMDVGEFAKAELSRVRAKNEAAGPQNLGVVKPVNQVPDMKAVEAEKEKALIAEQDEILNRILHKEVE